MNPTLDAALRSWSHSPWLLLGLVVSAAIYVRGWSKLHRRDPRRWPVRKLSAFVAGLASLYIALASPIEAFAPLLLQVHMLQHLLLMMLVPPLIWLGEPLLPLASGLPRSVRRVWLAPLARWPALRRLLARLTHPLVALPLFIAATWLWHLPRVYDAALAQPWLHFAQHVTFLLSALLFWYPVVRPYPSRPHWSPWLLLPYLIVADVQNTVLSALFTFSDRAFYAHYTQVPRLANIAVLEDQRIAGVLMWVPGSIAFLAPLFWIGVTLLYGKPTPRRAPRSVRPPGTFLNFTKHDAPVARQTSLDLLRLRLFGRALGWRPSRVALQLLVAGLALLVVYDGLRGPQVAAMNLAGVLPWIHWRGLLVLVLLVAGNFFCYACPLTLPRKLLARWLPPGRAWPRWLRGKWLAVILLAVFLWSYEAFSLWNSPWLTAWIVLGYFAAAFVIDTLFRGGSFCKYVCPVGQFNFLLSLLSPFEVRVRDSTACANCVSHDCIAGSAAVPGCELQLFQPRKFGNLDCTFCLDCAHACPHDNIGVLATNSLTKLWRDRPQAISQRLPLRADISALVLMLVFGGFANAAGMVEPVAAWQEGVAQWLAVSSRWLITSLFYGMALLTATASVFLAACVSRSAGKLPAGYGELIACFAYALVPLGAAMWLAHYSFHFGTSYETIVPATQRFIGELGLVSPGQPRWNCACCRPVGDQLLIALLLALDVGLMASLFVAWKVALAQASRPALALQAFAPWAMLVILLFALGVWLVFQPMEMRGTLPGGFG
jgi:cytochrome c oxidase assembly factor CtaG